jgi:predicted nucleic acid-binding Zn ribbon protein
VRLLAKEVSMKSKNFPRREAKKKWFCPVCEGPAAKGKKYCKKCKKQERQRYITWIFGWHEPILTNYPTAGVCVPVGDHTHVPECGEIYADEAYEIFWFGHRSDRGGISRHSA